jgi:hypothetical protein
MKFTIAVGILTQTFPGATSEKELATRRRTHHIGRYEDGVLPPRSLARIRQPVKSHRTLQSRASTTTTGRPLTNNPFSKTTSTKNCDPLSHDADIGILSCGFGQECIVDEASSLGGVCVQTSRELQAEKFCYVCGFATTIGEEFYGTVLDIPLAGYEGKTCQDIVAATYFDKVLRPGSSNCTVVAEAVAAGGCCAPICDLCGRAAIVDGSKYDVVIDDIPLAGYGNATCKSLFYSSYFFASISPESCPAIRQAAQEGGCCKPDWCELCAFGSYIPTGQCEELSAAAYYNRTVIEEMCPSSIQLAEQEGCCVASETFDCNLCGDGAIYPDNWVYKSGTCGYVQSALNDTDCAYYTPLLASMCCGPASAASIVPTVAPQESTPTPQESDAPPPPAPSSNSAILWSTSTLVSVMGLTAMTAGTFVLN